MVNIKYALGLLRVSMGLIFLWSFFDKLFGFGFSTVSGKAWINGVSPTFGFLTYVSKGPVSGLFNVIAGNVFVDWLFIIGLLLIGLSLLLGVSMRIGGYSGALLMFLMWLAVIPKEHNPILDEHVIYILVLVILANLKEYWFSLDRWWRSTWLVRSYSFLT